MKTLLLTLIFLFLVGCVSSSGSYTSEKRTRYYKNNSYIGYSKDVGNRTNFYNESGKYIGHSKK